jgi:hypothetical protein
MTDERDIIEKLMDFERCGHTAGDRINMRECAAIEIHKLRQENERYRRALEVIAGSADRLQALQAVAALDNIGAPITGAQ